MTLPASPASGAAPRSWTPRAAAPSACSSACRTRWVGGWVGGWYVCVIEVVVGGFAVAACRCCVQVLVSACSTACPAAHCPIAWPAALWPIAYPAARPRPCCPALPCCPQNPAMSVAKNHHQIILRAADAAEKYEWLARLRNASDSRGGVGRAPPLSATSQQLAAGQAPGSASRRSTTGSAGSESPAPPPKDRVGALAALLCCCPLRLPLRWRVWSELAPLHHAGTVCYSLAALPRCLLRCAALLPPVCLPLVPAGHVWARDGQDERPFWRLWRQQAGQRHRGRYPAGGWPAHPTLPAAWLPHARCC